MQRTAKARGKGTVALLVFLLAVVLAVAAGIGASDGAEALRLGSSSPSSG